MAKKVSTPTIIVIVVASVISVTLFVSVVIAALNMPTDEASASPTAATPTAVAQTSSAVAVPQPTESETTEAAPSEDLAQRVDAELKTQLGISSYTQMLDSDWVPYIASIEQVSSMTVVVTLQVTDVDEAYLEGVALKIMNLVGGNVKDVEWVQVNSADGSVGQISRADAPALDD